MLVFKSLHGLAPAYLPNEFSQARDFNLYNTRHRDLLRLPLARTTKYQGVQVQPSQDLEHASSRPEERA